VISPGTAHASAERFKIPRVIRRLAGALLLACALVALGAGWAAAEAPSGPRLALVRSGLSGKFELITVDAAGGALRRIAGGGLKVRPLPRPFSDLSWSADGSSVAFAGFSGDGLRRTDIYLVGADGSDLRKVPGTSEGFNPILSPDGHTLAFVRERQREGRHRGRGEVTVFHSFSVWLLDMNGGPARRLTPWRNGLFAFPSSFSPDGSTLAISRRQEKGEDSSRSFAVALRLDGTGATVLARNASGPVYSPDGSRVALLTAGRRRSIEEDGSTTTFTPTELAVVNADGTGLKRLTDTPFVLEMAPSWDPSGQRLAYTHFPVRGGELAFFGFGDSIMEINADGTCRTRVLSFPRAMLYGATWQPGPGREAGPIVCG
jgi:Tol biopolymer transport system component